MRNLQEQVKKAFFYQKWFWPFTVWINCSNDLKQFANSGPSAFKSFSRSQEQFFSHSRSEQFWKQNTISLIASIYLIFLGLGFANFMASCFVGLYYNMIIAWTIYYLFASFTSQLPWDTCDNDFNTQCKLFNHNLFHTTLWLRLNYYT